MRLEWVVLVDSLIPTIWKQTIWPYGVSYSHAFYQSTGPVQQLLTILYLIGSDTRPYHHKFS